MPKFRSALMLVLVLCLASEVAAQKLTIRVDTALNSGGNETTVKKDEAVNLVIATDEGAVIAVFTVPKINYVTNSGGHRVLFFAQRSCTFLVAAFKDGKVVKAEFKIKVEGSPPPTDPPGPKPPPKPPLKTDYSAETKTWLATVPEASRNKKDNQGNTVQKNLRDTLKEIGSSWKAAGSIKAMETLLTVGIQASLTPLGKKAEDWLKFAAAANKALDSVRDGGGTAEQYGAALVSIAKGLK